MGIQFRVFNFNCLHLVTVSNTFHQHATFLYHHNDLYLLLLKLAPSTHFILFKDAMQINYYIATVNVSCWYIIQIHQQFIP